MGWKLTGSGVGVVDVGNGRDYMYTDNIRYKLNSGDWVAETTWSDGRYGYFLRTSPPQNDLIHSGDRVKIVFSSDSRVDFEQEFTFNGSESWFEFRKKYAQGDNLKIEVYKYIPEPPSTPPDISVPSLVKEKDNINVSWGSGLRTSSYRLERSINGGSYTGVYSGSSRSYTDTALSTWNTVRYRVRGYNVDGYSSYRTSNSITVIHFPEMELRINGALKTSDMGWVKVNGALREIDTIWTKINGALKEVK